jgi:16S rRNA (uracil1498-N3)-methyltransferase
MDYFYTPGEHISRTEVVITGDEFNHLVHVMRKGAGDSIRVVDGKGNAYDVTLTRVKRKTAVGMINARHAHHNEPDIAVHLAVGVLKNPAKFDFLVEKVTELGVQRIVPLTSERTLPKHARVERWQKLALAAMKQCGRSVLPQVEKLQRLQEILTTVHGYDLAIVCHQSPEVHQSVANLAQKISEKSSILLVVGPEGGFSDREVDSCVKAGCSVASLGPRRLRTETAAIVAVGLVLQQWW